MVNRKNWLGILVIVLVFGITVVGCYDDSTDNGGDRTDPITTLNGTWVSGDDEENKITITFNNGNFEYKINSSSQCKGTYTTSGNNITLTCTQGTITFQYYIGIGNVLTMIGENGTVYIFDKK
jgi:amino acid transporter